MSMTTIGWSKNGMWYEVRVETELVTEMSISILSIENTTENKCELAVHNKLLATNENDNWLQQIIRCFGRYIIWDVEG